jgi:hypothetical protein
MTLLGGVSMEMATLQHSTEAAGGAPMRRWFQERGVIGAGVGIVDNGGALVVPFIGQLGSRRRRSRDGRQRRCRFNDTGYRRGKQGRGGDGLWPFSEGKRGRRQGGSTVLEVDDKTKSYVVVEEAQGGSCVVDDDQWKLGRWAECAIGSNY